MKRLFARTALVFALVFALFENSARADDDPWLAHDKFLHGAASGTLANLSYAGATQLFDSRGNALLAAAGVTVAVGAAKETLDLSIRGFGDPSWKDFTWDVIGTAAGLALAFGMDLFVRGIGPKHQLFSTPSGRLQSLAFCF